MEVAYINGRGNCTVDESIGTKGARVEEFDARYLAVARLQETAKSKYRGTRCEFYVNSDGEQITVTVHGDSDTVDSRRFTCRDETRDNKAQKAHKTPIHVLCKRDRGGENRKGEEGKVVMAEREICVGNERDGRGRRGEKSNARSVPYLPPR